jgi:hypothetical protein
MEDFTYKEYTEEENEIYNKAMDEIMEALKKGRKFNDACSAINVEDKELKTYIEDDALKIIIADMHYVKGLSLQNVADDLEVSIEIVNRANAEMMEDVAMTTTELYKINNPEHPIGNA